MLATTRPPATQLPPLPRGRWFLIGTWAGNHKPCYVMFWGHQDESQPPTAEEVQERLTGTRPGACLERGHLIFAVDHGEAQRVYRRQYSGRAIQQISASGLNTGAA